MSPKQFKGGAQPRTFFERTIRTAGGSRTIPVTKLLPKDWIYVRLRSTIKSKDYAIIEVQKLLGADELAQTTKSGKTGKQNPRRTRTTNSNKPVSSEK